MEDFARQLFAASPAVIYTCTVGDAFACTYISDNVQPLLGYRPEQFLSDPGFWRARLHPEDVPRVLEGLQALSVTGHYVDEYRFLRADGRYRWMLDQVRLLRNEATGRAELTGFWLDITERKGMEENYRRFVGLTSDYIHYCTRCHDASYRAQWFDGAVAAIFGYSSEELRQLGCFISLVHSDDRERLAAYLQGLRPGDSASIEFRIVTKHNEVRWISEKSRCEAGLAPGELILFGAGTDITERKEQERKQAELHRALWESRQTLGTILNTIPQAVFWKDRAGRYLGCNGNFAAATGVDDPAQIVGLSDVDLPWSPEETAAYRADDLEVIDSNRAKLNIVEPLRQADGRLLWIETSKMPLRDAAGEPFGVLGIYQDCTERKELEEALRDSEHLLQEAAQLARLGRWQWDVAVDQFHGSAIAKELFDLATLERPITYADVFAAIHPEDRARVEAAVRAALADGSDYAADYRVVHRDGAVRHVQGRGKVFGAGQGQATHMVGTVLDVTEQKQAELRLRESDRLKSEFIATASHELRTPLAVILGYSELLLDYGGFTPEQQREFLALIHDKAQALEKIIEDLLDISRVETGRLICLEFAKSNVVDEIHKVLAHFQREARHHRFSIQLPEEAAFLSFDRAKIVQVLENLLGNAVKFSPRGSEITVRAETRDDLFQVMIADQGVGISAEQQAHVFDKFYRVDGTDSAVPGLGIGLYLVKRIVDAHGGQMWVESAPGQGTRFYFTLPLRGR